MRKCPKCNKQYDDTWEVCLGCSEKLIETNSIEGAVQKCVEEARGEIRDIRTDIDTLQKRVNVLEGNLTKEKLIEKIKRIDKASMVKSEMPLQAQTNLVNGSLFKEENLAQKEDKQQETKSASLFKGEKKKILLSENFEQMLGEKWFNKLGIIAVVVGIVLLVGYSFRFFGVVGKLSVGYAFGLGLLGYGVYVEKKENLSAFGKSLVAGGWAINYFTTFAMYHIPEVRLIQSPFLGMFLLVLVSLASILHIYRYRSQLATSFSYLLMFITLTITPISLYTICAGVLVASSLIFFMYKMRWNSFAIYGMVMSYLSYITFLCKAPKVMIGLSHFISVTAVLAIYWTIFCIAGLLMKDDSQGGEVSKKDLTFIVNSIGATSCGCLLVNNGFEMFTLPLIGAGIAAHLLLTVGTFLYKKRSVYLISSTFAIGLSMLYVAIKLEGYPLTLAYIVLSQIVLLAGILLKENYWRQLASILLVGVFAKLMFVDSYISSYVVGTSIDPGNMFFGLNSRTVLFSGTFVLFLINHHLYSSLKKKNMLSKWENKWDILFSYFYPAIFAMGTWLDLPKVLTAPAWAILGVILLHIGISKKDEHRRIQGYILTIGAFGRLFLSNYTLSGGIGILSYRMLTVVPVLCMIYYCQLLLKEKTKEIQTLEGENGIPIFYTYMVFTGIMFLFRYELPCNLVAPVWGLVSLGYVIKSVTSREKYYLPICTIGALAAGIRVVFVNIIQPQYLVGASFNYVYPVITVIALYASNVICNKKSLISDDNDEAGVIKKFFRSTQFVYALTATVAVTALIIAKTNGVALTAGLAIEGLLLFLSGFTLKEKNWRLFGLLVLLFTLGKAFMVDLRKLETIYYILSLISLGMVLLFVSYIYNKHKDRIGKIL